MIADNVHRIPDVNPFTVADSGESRQDLASRTEVKFTFRDADVRSIRQILRLRCKQQSFSESVSSVYSLYFDDQRFSNCYANLNGDGERQKLRLRWYDSPLAEQEFYCEIKWRKNRTTGKHRYQIHSTKPARQLPLRSIHRYLEAVMPTKHLRHLVAYTEPVLMVRYRREHFIASDKALRITLDYDLTYFDQVGKKMMSAAFAKPLRGLVVMEGKTPVGRENELRNLFAPLEPRVGRCSKYVHGCQLLGHVEGD